VHLIEHLTEAVDRYWTVDVEILGSSDDGPAASVMLRRTPAVKVMLGSVSARVSPGYRSPDCSFIS
jgi:hypothetical protein